MRRSTSFLWAALTLAGLAAATLWVPVSVTLQIENDFHSDLFEERVFVGGLWEPRVHVDWSGPQTLIEGGAIVEITECQGWDWDIAAELATIDMAARVTAGEPIPCCAEAGANWRSAAYIFHHRLRWGPFLAQLGAAALGGAMLLGLLRWRSLRRRAGSEPATAP